MLGFFIIKVSLTFRRCWNLWNWLLKTRQCILVPYKENKNVTQWYNKHITKGLYNKKVSQLLKATFSSIRIISMDKIRFFDFGMKFHKLSICALNVVHVIPHQCHSSSWRLNRHYAEGKQYTNIVKYKILNWNANKYRTQLKWIMKTLMC